MAKWARNKGIIVVAYVPDLPQFQYYYTKKQSSLIKRIFTPVYISLTNSLNHVYDGYVFMTKYMESLFPKRPSIIIEGIVPTNDREVCTIARENDVFVVMYAGSLHESMGVRKLVDAFGEGLDDVELWIYGSGDSEEYIMEKAKNHNNIKFYGRVKYETILEQEKKADLLVNPRCSENEFTKYSFPSKLMEYMQSGTPVLTTRLKGIPEDYYDYMFFIDNETIDGVRSAIRETLSLGKETLCQIGEKASRYVLHNKNSTVQASKVYYFIDSIEK